MPVSIKRSHARERESERNGRRRRVTQSASRGDDNMESREWSGTVTFGDATALNTTASFSAAGTDALRLTASDSVLSTTDDVTITVNRRRLRIKRRP